MDSGRKSSKSSSISYLHQSVKLSSIIAHVHTRPLSIFRLIRTQNIQTHPIIVLSCLQDRTNLLQPQHFLFLPCKNPRNLNNVPNLSTIHREFIKILQCQRGLSVAVDSAPPPNLLPRRSIEIWVVQCQMDPALKCAIDCIASIGGQDENATVVLDNSEAC